METTTEQTPELKLEGRSGCALDIFSDNGNFFVRKSSVSQSYSERLGKQAAKQASYKNASNTTFVAPKVINEGANPDGIYHFDMEYVHGEKFSDYLSKATIYEINDLYNLFENYFEGLFNASEIKEVEKSIIKDKVKDIEQKLLSNNFYSSSFKKLIINTLLNKVPKQKLPLGTCHGDFTFSNILFSGNDKVYIFDFLDSFIESPIIDLVKIRQDTKFYWSIDIDVDLETAKKGRVTQVLQHLDKRFANYIDTKYPEYKDWYNYLELFNLVRIMPYAHNIRDVHFLQKNLQKLIS